MVMRGVKIFLRMKEKTAYEHFSEDEKKLQRYFLKVKNKVWLGIERKVIIYGKIIMLYK